MIYKPNAYIATRNIENELVLTNAKNGTRIKISKIPADIWKFIKNGESISFIIKKISNKYGNEWVSYIDQYIKNFLDYDLISEDNWNDNNQKDLCDFDKASEKSIVKAGLVLTNMCNFRCVHCYNACSSRYEKELELYEWKNIIDQIISKGCLDVLITGGEPFLNENIFNILDYLEKSNIVFEVNTNASLIDNKMIDNLKKYRFLKRINISLYGTSDNIYYSITKNRVSVSDIINTYKNLNINGIECNLKFIFMKYNYEDAKNIIMFEKKHNIKIDKQYNYIHSNLNGEKDRNLNLSPAQIKYLYKEKCLSLNDRYNPLCKCGKERCSIDPYGNMSICEKLSTISFGNLRQLDLDSITKGYEFNEFISKNLSNQLCLNCEAKEYCFRCDGLSYLETGARDLLSEEVCIYAREIKKIINNCV